MVSRRVVTWPWPRCVPGPDEPRSRPMPRLPALLACAFTWATAGCGASGVLIKPDGQAIPFRLVVEAPTGPPSVIGPGAPTSEAVPDLSPGTASGAPAGSPAAPATRGQPPAGPPPVAPVVVATASPATGPTAGSGRFADELQAKHGIRISGYPTATGLSNLAGALALYPAGSVRGAHVHFTGRNGGDLGGTWETGGVIRLYQERPHTIAHELAHHIIEQNRTRWGSTLKGLLASSPRDVVPSSYALAAAAGGRWEEAAAESLAYFAEGRWRPQSTALSGHLSAMLANQPHATA